MKKLVILALLSSGCAMSLVPGWRKPPTTFSSNGSEWTINVASWYEVQWRCGLGFLALGGALGCADQVTKTVWAINNPAVMWHECNHIDGLEKGGSELTEWIKDIFYGWHINNALFLATLPLPASENPCNDAF